MVDEVTSHNHELMPLCVRFVDVQKNIREEFIQFSTLSCVTGEAIAARICSDLTNLGLDLKNIRGQGYDGASSISSNRVGVYTSTHKTIFPTSFIYSLQWTLLEPSYLSFLQLPNC